VAERMAAAFVGHGSPMNALERNRFTIAWAELAASMPRPRAVLAISAHWYVGVTAVTAMAKPRVIHDFGGFPDELFAFDYPAPGSPQLAADVADLLAPVDVMLDGSWGLDHGTWSVLAQVFPAADVPVVQLSLDATKPFADHVALGAALSPLRDEGIFVVASGNVVHNLALIDWGAVDSGFDWADRFDDAAREVLMVSPDKAAGLADHRDFSLASGSTPDHFLPFLYFAGLASAGPGTVSTVTEGTIMGSLSMASYRLDG
jgi:4,5-DOPA dioxygenase extradiol